MNKIKIKKFIKPLIFVCALVLSFGIFLINSPKSYAYTYLPEENYLISDNLFNQANLSKLEFRTSGNSDGNRFKLSIYNSTMTQEIYSSPFNYFGNNGGSCTFNIDISSNYIFRVGINGNVQDDKVSTSVYLYNGTYTFTWNGLNGANYVKIEYIMLNKGTTALLYEPYNVAFYPDTRSFTGFTNSLLTITYGDFSTFYPYNDSPISQGLFSWNFSYIIDNYDFDINIDSINFVLANPFIVNRTNYIYFHFRDSDLTFNVEFTFDDNSVSTYRISSDYDYLDTGNKKVQSFNWLDSDINKSFKTFRIIGTMRSPDQCISGITYGDGFQAYNLGYAQGVANTKLENSEELNKAYKEKANLKSRLDNLQERYDALLEGQSPFSSLIFTIVESPLVYFNQIWNFDILGFNIAKFVLGCLTTLLIIWIIKKIL